jgi:7,8-dihydropterin-6-yl-methyl-4-(beta-D-ribofuranosyl)aminobenzene 5'-phosphate synthase
MQKVFLIHLAAIAAVAVAFHVATPSQAEDRTSGSITVVYNHEGSAAADNLVKSGGFGVFVQLEDQFLMFDAGGEASVILENLHSLGFADTELEALVISHNHWDHVFGLPGVMSGARNRHPVYVAASAADGIRQQFPRATVVAVDGPKQVAPEVWLTGPLEIDFMGAPLSEQALVLDLPNGLHVIVGCSHPGIVTIVERVREMFPEKPIALVAGGFHLRSTGEDEIRQIASDLERLGVRKIGPSHCTGSQAVRIFRELWGENFVTFDLGDTYRF